MNSKNFFNKKTVTICLFSHLLLYADSCSSSSTKNSKRSSPPLFTPPPPLFTPPTSPTSTSKPSPSEVNKCSGGGSASPSSSVLKEPPTASVHPPLSTNAAVSIGNAEASSFTPSSNSLEGESSHMQENGGSGSNSLSKQLASIGGAKANITPTPKGDPTASVHPPLSTNAAVSIENAEPSSSTPSSNSLERESSHMQENGGSGSNSLSKQLVPIDGAKANITPTPKGEPTASVDPPLSTNAAVLIENAEPSSSTSSSESSLNDNEDNEKVSGEDEMEKAASPNTITKPKRTSWLKENKSVSSEDTLKSSCGTAKGEKIDKQAVKKQEKAAKQEREKQEKAAKQEREKQEKAAKQEREKQEKIDKEAEKAAKKKEKKKKK
ncbi:hypothetical protein [Candidatus Cardinium hertigii]|uniref:Uncharacterized protein n=1 Tax=Candidatus Cardinium hertigii TaxID=247481 RepID=A0A2Z3L7C6_9BACT|nr:hypothetical protein [Candidatus Cardinium hertigii]AWN81349.1 hypothetical protein DK880_00006 [Candidatus Cardinium hertigii]